MYTRLRDVEPTCDPNQGETHDLAALGVLSRGRTLDLYASNIIEGL